MKLPVSTVYYVASRCFAALETEAGARDADRKFQDRSMSRNRSLDFVEMLEELVEEDPSSLRGL